MTIDFGKTAEDYASFRAGFPDAFFDQLVGRGLVAAETRALDIGTGTGTVARGLASKGARVTALDPSEELLDQARRLAAEAELEIDFRSGKAEQTELPANAFELIVAGQCWHWFDRSVAAIEARRLLVPGSYLVIAHFDWLPLPGSVVAATEAMIFKHNPGWTWADGDGRYPAWRDDFAGAGFEILDGFEFDIDVAYSHAAWRGRVRASAGIAASLAPDAVAAFDAAHGAMLATEFPEDPLALPHRVWALIGRAPR